MLKLRGHLLLGALLATGSCLTDRSSGGGEGAGTDDNGDDGNDSVADGDDGNDSNDDNDTFDPDSGDPGSCFTEDGEFQPGDEWETADGCERFECGEYGEPQLISSKVTAIDGSVLLTSEEGLEELRCVERIGEDLTIQDSELWNMAGKLPRLREIGGSLVVRNNVQMQDVQGFVAWLTVFGDIRILDNPEMKSLAGLQFLANCQGCGPGESLEERAAGAGTGGNPDWGIVFGVLEIRNNDNLQDISSIGGLGYGWGDIIVSDNDRLPNLSGFFSLMEVQGDLEIMNNAALPPDDASNLSVQTIVYGETRICGNLGEMSC